MPRHLPRPPQRRRKRLPPQQPPPQRPSLTKPGRTSSSPVLKNTAATVTGGTRQDLANAVSPFGINYAYFTQERKRISYVGTVQAKPTDDITLTLNGLHIDGNYNNSSQSMYVIPGAWSGDVLQSATVANGVVTNASFGAPSAGSPSAQLDLLIRKTKLTTDNLNFVGEWEGPGGASVSATAGWSKAIGGRNPEYLLDVRTDLPYSYGFTSDSANVDYVGDLTNGTMGWRTMRASWCRTMR